VTEECTESFNYRQLNATFIKLAIHLGFIGFLAYWTFVLVGPFIPIIVWSVVLTVALYPVFDWLAAVLGGRRGLAATSGATRTCRDARYRTEHFEIDQALHSFETVAFGRQLCQPLIDVKSLQSCEVPPSRSARP